MLKMSLGTHAVSIQADVDIILPWTENASRLLTINKMVINRTFPFHICVNVLKFFCYQIKHGCIATFSQCYFCLFFKPKRFGSMRLLLTKLNIPLLFHFVKKRWIVKLHYRYYVFRKTGYVNNLSYKYSYHND